MAHVPHLLVPGPWHGDLIDVTGDQRKHLAHVLRRPVGSPVSYTDGCGTIGDGTWTGDAIERSVEVPHPEPTANLTLAVAPPDSKDRLRWLVEKATELGVARIRWIRTQFGQGRLPRSDKARAWMTAAVEQSRRSRVTVVDADWSDLDGLGTFVAADQTGEVFQPAGTVIVAIGPEGGWGPAEIESSIRRVSFGPSVLRTETAAIAAAALFNAELSRRMNQ